ncbi:MAG: RtcB family protein [Saprospirales bacterium]|nr:MAG: RtcB family protein [Saprospirales bacterium]
MNKKLKIFGREIIDDQSVAQLENCLTEESIGVLTADAHYGYGHPIGGAVAYPDHISLSGVGFDIACGNKAVKTALKAKEIDTSAIMDEIVRKIGFGIGKPNPIPAEHPVIDELKELEIKAPGSFKSKLISIAREQLGTVGAGNHFVDLFEDEEGYLWIGVHFGSRGFGHKLTTGFISLSQGLKFEDRPKNTNMDSDPILFHIKSEMGIDYIQAIELAGKYAYAGRDIVVDTVLSILGTRATDEVHNHHNFAWREEHFATDYWVVRKGCTPAFPGQKGFIGSNMFDTSVIIEGVDSPDSADGLYSTVHGAGRVMSRRKAKGKTKWVKGRDGKRKIITTSPGLVDFDKTQQKARELGIELRGGGADESPECYKSLEEVLKYQGNTIKVLHRLKPIGVAMAGDDDFDPYID